MLKVINMGAMEAKEIGGLLPNTVMISINEPEYELAKLKIDRNSSKVLTMRFWDVTGPKTDITDSSNIYNPISDEQILELLNFININKNKNFLVHCRAGVSRSSAVALFIHLQYGHELKKNFWTVSRPNAYVLGQLIINREKKILLSELIK